MEIMEYMRTTGIKNGLFQRRKSQENTYRYLTSGYRGGFGVAAVVVILPSPGLAHHDNHMAGLHTSWEVVSAWVSW